jgi:aspartyl-tRNA(Asn)/glutamyl-tRNA(Gln) amidotransferase subunit A
VAVDLLRTSVRELGDLLRTRKVSALESVNGYLARAEALNPELNAFITITAAHARARAAEADAEIGGGRYRGPLHGVPYAVKDLLATRGIRTTNASRVTADWAPDTESTITDRLNRAGAILIGKLNLREFATGSGVLSGFGVVRNPWGLEYTAAGSSSGSGAAVAARMAPLAVGTDTGGSIRGPVAVCGIVGLKPTYGRVSLRGVTPLGWSLDHAGSMTVLVEDAALMLQVMAGADPGDPTSAREPVPDYTADLGKGIAGVRIGLPRRHFTEGSHAAVEQAYREAVKTLESLGGMVVAVDIPHADLAPAAGGIISMAEAATFHEKRLRETPELFDPLVRERLEVARFYTATDYLKAQRVRSVLMEEVADAFESCDVIAVPAYPRLPARQEAAATAGSDVKPGSESRVYRASNSYIANMTGMPALVLPCGYSSGQPILPIALQLYGRPFDEAMLFRTGHAYQRATGWHTRIPPVALKSM